MGTLVEPKAAPDLNIPSSSSTVIVRVIDSTTRMKLPAPFMVEPEIKGFDKINAPNYCFLISHGDKNILFDLAVRKDWKEALPPHVVSMISQAAEITMEDDIADILERDTSGIGIQDVGVRPKNVDAIIWSHHHMDHTGDPSKFPNADLVVGPGFKKNCMPGYPKNQEAANLDADFEGRNVVEIDFSKDPFKIGQFNAHDYFGDGSFYLLDSPGHDIGHMCGLARVTKDSFIMMGADACHHPGVFRPTEYLPIPKNITPSPVKKFAYRGCPGAAIQEIHPKKSANEPFLTPGSAMCWNHDDDLKTVNGILDFDANENIMVIMAHDNTLRNHLELYPEPENNWKTKGIKPKVRWLFCKDFENAME